MPKVKTHVARKDIYSNGLRTEDATKKKGFSLDRSKPRDDKDTIFINKGETYYAWSLFGDKSPRISKTPPTRQQLTRSDFKISLYNLEDRLSGLNAGNYSDNDEFKSEIESIIEDIRSLADEQEEKLGNMPESLQYAPTGEILQNRADELNNWAEYIEGVDLDCDECEEGEDIDETALTEHLENKIEELQACSYEGE